MSEIKPCICGRIPMLVSTSPTMIRVGCLCGYSTAWVSTESEAVQRWNEETTRREIMAQGLKASQSAAFPTWEEIESWR